MLVSPTALRRWVTGPIVPLCLGLSLAITSRAPGAPVEVRLVEAVKNADTPAVRALLKTDVDVNVPEADGTTALHWAVRLDLQPLADILIAAGADVMVANLFEVTPLSLAAINGNRDMIGTLLAAGADPNVAMAKGEAALLTAARTGKADAIHMLVAYGADVNVTQGAGQTPLMWAAAERHSDIVKVLLEHGADVRAVSEGGATVLLIAAREDELAIAGLLISAGANVNDMAPDGTTPLIVATVRGHAELAMLLLDHGADPNTVATGYTALHWASGSWHTELTGRLRGIATERDDEWLSLNGLRSGKLELVEALLARGADPDVRLAAEPPQFGYASPRFRVSLVGATPFLLAAMDGNISVMRVLASAGADPLLGTDRNTTPLMVAAGLGRVPAETRVTEKESLQAVQLALELGADVNSTNDVGRTALHGAAHVRSDTIVQLLVDEGAMLNVADERGVTPLMIAEGGGHIFLPGLGGGSTAELLRTLGSSSSAPSSVIENFTEGATRRKP